MRVVNEKFETIVEYDLSKGELLEVTTLREDAVPVDNVTKFAPDDEDWEQALMYVSYSKQPETEVNIPSQLDIIEAQITYTAMMTDTLLEVTDNV